MNGGFDFRKKERKPWRLGPSTFGLREALERMNRVLSRTAARRGIPYRTVIARDLPDQFTGDWVRLNRVLVNLVGNALEFTREGCVSLHVSKVESSGHTVTLRFSVSDTGAGISMDRLDVLLRELNGEKGFEVVERRESGPGLAMASRQAEVLGGYLFVQSREGEGSTFHFTVALYSPELSPIPETTDWFPLEKR